MNNILEIKEYTDKEIQGIAAMLRKRKIVVMPSDTIYGFLAHPDCERKVRDIKKRDNKPFLYLISRCEQLAQLGIDITDYSVILERYWPGPITFIMKRKKPLPGGYFDSLGVRMPAWEVLRKIIDKTGMPLISTSVNFSGESSFDDIDGIIEKFGSLADLIVADRNFNSNISSTIVDLTARPYKILRKGSMDFNEIS